MFRRCLSRAAIAAGMAAASAVHLHAHQVKVRWDPDGVAHVQAGTDAAVFFGQGYAAAKDRLAEMHLVRMSAQGRLLELRGDPEDDPEEGAGGTPQGKTPGMQDREMLVIQLYRAAVEREQKLDGMTREALQAYADGVNAYIDELEQRFGAIPQGDPPTAEDLALLPELLEESHLSDFRAGTFEEWVPADSIACWEWWAYWFSGKPFKEVLAELKFQAGDVTENEARVDDLLAILQEADVDNGFNNGNGTNLAAVDTYICEKYLIGDVVDSDLKLDPVTGGADDPLCSDAWAISKGRTTTNGAALFADPHTALINPSQFHQVHLINTHPEVGFNVRGISLVGCPAFFLAYNRDVTWGVTSFGVDIMDLVQLDTDQNGEYSYDADGDGTAESHTLLIESKTLPNPQGPNPTFTFPVTTSVLGPVVTTLVTQTSYESDAGQTFNERDELVLRTNFNVDIARHSIQAAIRMMKARSVEEYRESAKYWVTPALHSVSADSSGSICYTPLVAVPTRGDLSNIHSVNGAFALGDGSDPKNADWQRHVPYDLLPWTIRDTGELLVANQRPAGTWYELPLGLRSSSKGPNARSLRLHQLFRDDTGDLSPDEIADAAFDAVNPVRRAMVKLLTKLPEIGSGSNPNSTPPINEICNTTNILPVGICAEIGSRLGDFHHWLDLTGNDGQSLTTSLGPDPDSLETYKLILLLSQRIKDHLAPALAGAPPAPELPILREAYGAGKTGGTSLARDLANRDFSCQPFQPIFSPANQATNMDAEILLWITHALDMALFQLSNQDVELTAEFPGTYFGMTASFGGHLPSLNDAKDREVSFQVLEGATLWAGRGKSYPQFVSFPAPAVPPVLPSPSEAFYLHPFSNHEDPDHPTLGEHFGNDLDGIWTDGLQGGHARAGMNPSDLDFPIRAESDVHQTLNFNADAGHYGIDYAGPDPQAALSLEIIDAPVPVRPGDSVTFRIEGLPNEAGWTGQLKFGKAATHTETAGPAVLLTDAVETPVTIPLSFFGEVEGGDLTVEIPYDFTGLLATFQVVIESSNPATMRTSSGIAVMIDQSGPISLPNDP